MEEKEPKPKSLDELSTQIEALDALEAEVLNLSGTFNTLVMGLREKYRSGISDISMPNETEVNDFLNWRNRFEAAAKNAEMLGVIEKGFLEKYTQAGRENDPLWRQIRTLLKNDGSLLELTEAIEEIQAGQKNRYEAYAEVGTHPAAWAFTVGVLPLLILLLYCIDRAINAARLAIKEYQKSSAQEEVSKATAVLDNHPIKSHLYSQAVIAETTPFFKPVKEKAAEEVTKEAKEGKKPESLI